MAHRTFHPTSERLADYAGRTVTSMQPLSEEFYDRDETGPMFVIEVEGLDGVVHAFGDEVRTHQPEPEITPRGFQRHPPVPSEYGGHIETYESSAASGPHLWVNIECPVDLNNPAGAKKDATVHLTLENATLLRDQLTQLIENHYQVR